MDQLSSVTRAVLNAGSNKRGCLLAPQVTQVLCSRELVKRVFRRHQSVALNFTKFKSLRNNSNCPYICV